jgi:hypothetical protein
VSSPEKGADAPLSLTLSLDRRWVIFLLTPEAEAMDGEEGPIIDWRDGEPEVLARSSGDRATFMAGETRICRFTLSNPFSSSINALILVAVRRS